MVISLGRGRGVRGHTKGSRPRLSLGVPDVCLPLTPPRPQHPHTSLSPRATATTSVSVTVYGSTLERNGRAQPSLPFAVVGFYTVGVKRNLPHDLPHVLVTHAPRAKALTPQPRRNERHARSRPRCRRRRRSAEVARGLRSLFGGASSEVRRCNCSVVDESRSSLAGLSARCVSFYQKSISTYLPKLINHGRGERGI